uniref:Small ribosomal subunit protein uS3c n=1 Tax=Paulinella chromatophora TaxID=39717 RepID=B1X502_PAUCH|nr:30S ribosomal protein S3 [Paulinella chromatophora]ACB43021.1 30S ribosomal protein S3 [Paulinella chromatophora]
MIVFVHSSTRSTLLQVLSDIIISRKADQLEVELRTARPGVLVGRQGSGIEELRNGIQKILDDLNRQIRINVVEIERVDADAYLLAEYIAQQLEKRMAFRRAIRMATQRAQRAGVLGLKIQVSGRLNGAEIARTEWTREGRVPLHTLRADIDYATKVASTSYGVLGIKVWVFKGEVIQHETRQPPTGVNPKRRPNRRSQQPEDNSNEE